MNLNNINHIQNNLFASSKDFVNNPKQILLNSIKIIISLNGIKSDISSFNTDVPITHHVYSTQDDPNFPIEKYANEIYDIIISNESIGNNVLIHCDAGASRTGYFVIYYLMKKNNIKYEEAFNIAINKRKCILPNEGFELKLKLLELDNNIDNLKFSSNVKFINYKNLINELNTNNFDNIIGIGQGMSWGNYFINIPNNIDSLLTNIDNILEKIYLSPSSLVYGDYKIIQIIENIYNYKKNIIKKDDINKNIFNLTNEEESKINNYLIGKYKKESSNILDITEEEIKSLKSSELANLLAKLDIYICTGPDEKIIKKKLTKIIYQILNN